MQKTRVNPLKQLFLTTKITLLWWCHWVRELTELVARKTRNEKLLQYISKTSNPLTRKILSNNPKLPAKILENYLTEITENYPNIENLGEEFWECYDKTLANIAGNPNLNSNSINKLITHLKNNYPIKEPGNGEFKNHFEYSYILIHQRRTLHNLTINPNLTSQHIQQLIHLEQTHPKTQTSHNLLNHPNLTKQQYTHILLHGPTQSRKKAITTIIASIHHPGTPAWVDQNTGDHNETHQLLYEATKDRDPNNVALILSALSLTPETWLHELSSHPHPIVRSEVAKQPNLPTELVTKLVFDTSRPVQEIAAAHPNAPEWARNHHKLST